MCYTRCAAASGRRWCAASTRHDCLESIFLNQCFLFFRPQKAPAGIECELWRLYCMTWEHSPYFFLPCILFWLGWADKLPLQWGQQDENNVFRYNTSTHTHAVEVCVCSHIEKHSLKKREGVESVSFNETTSHSHSILFVPSIYSSQCVRVPAISPTNKTSENISRLNTLLHLLLLW